MPPDPDHRGLVRTLVGDGRPLIALTALALLFSGAFALFLSAGGHFLPHDVAYLGMTSQELCAHNQCRIVHFMFHDRVSFGGALIAIAALYFWLNSFPLAAGKPWAWWTLALSGVVGFASFLTYLGYGYLDTWHGAATLVMLPAFAGGLWLTWRGLKGPRSWRAIPRAWIAFELSTPLGRARALLTATGVALVLGGLVISTVGMTTVFVPQDLQFMDISAEQLRSINPRLIPLIAHDRAGFGGGVCCCGVAMCLCAACGTPSPALWQALLIAGTVGFGTAIGVHPIVGYTSATHLAPAIIGVIMFVAGIVTSRPGMHGAPRGRRVPESGEEGPTRTTATR